MSCRAEFSTNKITDVPVDLFTGLRSLQHLAMKNCDGVTDLSNGLSTDLHVLE